MGNLEDMEIIYGGKKNSKMFLGKSQTWWSISVTPALGRQRQEDFEF
jgi:hypothetical protein